MMSGYLQCSPFKRLEPLSGSDVLSMESIKLAQIGQRLTRLAWAGGLIDGEGYVGINKNSVKLDVQSTSRVTIETLYEIFKGHCAVESRRTATGRPVFRWSVSGKNALMILATLTPYLVEKKRQAELSISYHRFPPRSAMRESIERRIRALKRVV